MLSVSSDSATWPVTCWPLTKPEQQLMNDKIVLYNGAPCEENATTPHIVFSHRWHQGFQYPLGDQPVPGGRYFLDFH